MDRPTATQMEEYVGPSSRQNSGSLDAETSDWAPSKTLFLGVVFGAVFLFLAFRHANWDTFLDTLRSAKFQVIGTGILAYVGYLLTRAARWSLLLAERTTERPFALLFRAVTWGTAANAIVPHSGELLRAFATKKKLGVSASSILGTIAAERFYDFAAVIALSTTALVFFRGAPPILFSALVAIVAMGGVVLCVIVLVGTRNPLMNALLSFVAVLLPKRFAGAAQHQIQELTHGIRAAFSNPHVTLIVVLSLVQWLLVTSCIFAAIAAFSVDVSAWVAFVILPLTIAGLTLPTAPAYLGTIQVCFLGGLAPFGIANETAIAVSFGYLGIVTFPVIVVSAFWFVGHLIVRRRPL